MNVKTIFFTLFLSIILQKGHTQTPIPDSINLSIKKYTINTTDTASVIFKNKTTNIQNKYINKGYAACEVYKIVSKKNKTEVYFLRGNKYKINSLKIIDTDSSLVIFKKYCFKPKLSHKNYDKLLLKHIAQYNNNGYPFASFTNKTFYNNKLINVFLVLNKGNYVVYDSIILPPKSPVKYNYITALTGIKPNTPYKNILQNNISVNIINTGFLTPDSIITSINNNLVTNRIYIRNLKSNAFDGIIGIQQNNSSKTLITGNINLNLVNLFKNGESILVNWQSANKESQNAAIELSWPYIKSLPIGLFGNLFIDKTDTVYLNTNIKAGIQTNIFKRLQLMAYYNNLLSATNDTLLYNNSKSQLYGISIISKKNNINNTTANGYFINIDASTGTRKVNNNKTNQTISTAGYIIAWQHLLSKNYVFFQSQAKIILSPHLSTNELYTTGGLKSIRGIPEKSINSSNFNILTCEYRANFENKLLLYALCDLAFVKNINNSTFDKYLSVGIGTTIYTQAGNIKIIYAVAKKNTSQFNINNSKVHVGYNIVF